MTGWLVSLLLAFAAVSGFIWYNRLSRRFRMLKTAAAHSNDGLLLQKMDGTVIWVNQAYCDLFGRPYGFWIGKKPQKWVLPAEICPSDEEIAAFRYDPDGPQFQQLELCENMHVNGTRFWNQLSLACVDIGKEEPIVVLSSRDVTAQVNRERALESAKEQLEQAVNYDALTGLANRRMLMTYLSEALREAAATNTRVGFLAIDLDKFKDTNDTHGHAAGDAVLKAAARIFKSSVTESSLVARTGGDEFMVVLRDVKSVDPMKAVGIRILREMADPVIWNEVSLHFGASLGIALSQPGQRDVEDLLQKADFALYDAKARGRGKFSVYDASLRSRHVAQRDLAEDLIEALRDAAMAFHFQPIVNLSTMKVIGVEALARWNHPTRGLLPAGEFLALAEEMGVLEQVDMAAMEAALQARQLLDLVGLHDIYVSFNVSLQTLSKPDLGEALTWRVIEEAIEPGTIAVEVLESALLSDQALESDVARHIKELAKAGFQTRLDDFGTGYAGLKHLADLKTHGIKMDGALVEAILVDETSDIIVRAILRLARALDMDVIAEGVEEPQIADRLKTYGCPAIQGYVVAQPMPFDDLLAWLTQFNESPKLIEPGERAVG